MDFRLISAGWDREILAARRRAPNGLQIICPFIKLGTLREILATGAGGPLRVITRLDLNCFNQGVSDIAALERVIAAGGTVRGLHALHSKLYLLGGSIAIATSANVTDAAMRRNHEFGFISGDTNVVAACGMYFQQLWDAIGNDVTVAQLRDWSELVAARRQHGAGPLPDPLPDFGARVSIASPFQPLPDEGAGPFENQAFVKFSGTTDDRASRSQRVDDVVAESGCAWAFTFPTKRHPRQVNDGDLLYIGRLVRSENDLMIFGKAIGRRHRDGEDEASQDEIALRPWKAGWANYVRVHSGRFIDATLGDGVSFREMLDALGSDSFPSTQGAAERGEGNTNPFRSYWRKASMPLTDRSRAWLDVRIEEKLRRHGEVDLSEPRFGMPGLPA